MRCRNLFAFFLLFGTTFTYTFAQTTANPPAAGTSAVEPRLETAIAGLKRVEKALYLYEHTERQEIRKNSGDADPTSVKVLRVIPAGTGIARIPVGDDGKPDGSAAYRAAIEKLVTDMEWAATPGKTQREAYEKISKKQKEREDLIEATRTAFLFTFLTHERRADRTLSKFRMDPNPEYKPTNRSNAIFKKIRGFVWIDDVSGEMARVEGEVIDDISLGIFLAKVYKGSRFLQDRYELAPGLWFPTFSQYDFDGRKLFSSISIHEKTFYKDYKRVGPPSEAVSIIRAEAQRLNPSGGSSKP